MFDTYMFDNGADVVLGNLIAESIITPAVASAIPAT